jgi:hypothetical protein
MTSAQKTAISSKTDGLIVYDTDLSQLNVYNSATPNTYSQTVRICSFQCVGASSLVNCTAQTLVTANYPSLASPGLNITTSHLIPIFYNPINNTLLGNSGQTYNCCYLEMNPNVTSNTGSAFTFNTTTGYITCVYTGFYNISSDCRHLNASNAVNTMMLIVKNPVGSGSDYVIGRSDGPSFQSASIYTGEVSQTSTASTKLNAGDKIRIIIYSASTYAPTITISIIGFL